MTDEQTLARYEASLTPETAMKLGEMQHRVENPKKPREATVRKPKKVTAQPHRTLPHDAHVRAAAPLRQQRRITLGLGHDQLPLAYFATAKSGDLIADVCTCRVCLPGPSGNPPLGPKGWGIAVDASQTTDMGPGFSALGIPRA